jgi:SET domain-containing protein
MALLEKIIFVKKSGLPGAGKGLFAKKFIPKGARIVEYKGKITTWKEVDSHDGNNGYIYYVKRNYVIDASGNSKALARYANDAKGLTRVKGISNNAHYQEEGNRVFIEAIKDIPAGSEIFVEYGKEYWQVIRHNQRVDRQRAKLNGTKKKG